MASVRKDGDFLLFENGEIIVKKEQVFSADLGSEFKLQQAFTRRGIALDRVGVLTFEVRERIFSASRAALPGAALG